MHNVYYAVVHKLLCTISVWLLLRKRVLYTIYKYKCYLASPGIAYTVKTKESYLGQINYNVLG